MKVEYKFYSLLLIWKEVSSQEEKKSSLHQTTLDPRVLPYKYMNGSSLDNPYELCNRINVFLSKASLKNLLIQHKILEKKTIYLKGLYSKLHSIRAYLGPRYYLNDLTFNQMTLGNFHVYSM